MRGAEGGHICPFLGIRFFLRTNGRTNGLTKVFHEALADLKIFPNHTSTSQTSYTRIYYLMPLKSTMIHKNTSSLCKELLGFVHCQFCCRQTTDSRPILGPLTRENHFHLQRNDAHNYNKYAEIFMSLLFFPSYFKS